MGIKKEPCGSGVFGKGAAEWLLLYCVKVLDKLEFDALLMLLNPINSILYKFDKWFTGQILGRVCRNDTADFSLAIGVNPYSRLNAVL